MVTMRLHADGPLPADEVWERYAQPDRWATWSPQIVRVNTAVDRITAGAAGRVVGPVGVSMDFQIDAVDEAAHTWTWTAHRWPVTLHLEHGVEAHGVGSATWLTVRGPLPVLLGYLPVARLALHHLVHP